MTAIRVATVAALEMIGSGEDQVWAFVVEVFGQKLLRGVLGRWGWWNDDGFDGILHCWDNPRTV
jgi:hypothetical protein